jgi:hypothetical protein
LTDPFFMREVAEGVAGREGPDETASTSIGKDNSAALPCARCDWLAFFVTSDLGLSIVVLVAIRYAVGAAVETALVDDESRGVECAAVGIGVGFTPTSMSIGVGIGICVDDSPDIGAGIGVVFCPSFFANDCLVDAEADGSFAIAAGFTGACDIIDLGGVGGDSSTGVGGIGSRSDGAGVGSGVGSRDWDWGGGWH